MRASLASDRRPDPVISTASTLAFLDESPDQWALMVQALIYSHGTGASEQLAQLPAQRSADELLCRRGCVGAQASSDSKQFGAVSALEGAPAETGRDICRAQELISVS